MTLGGRRLAAPGAEGVSTLPSVKILDRWYGGDCRVAKGADAPAGD